MNVTSERESEMNYAESRIKISGHWGSARIVHSDATTFAFEWPWYWRVLNRLRGAVLRPDSQFELRL